MNYFKIAPFLLHDLALDLEKEVSSVSTEVQALQNSMSEHHDDLAKINKMEADIFDRYQLAGVKLSNGKHNREDIKTKMLTIEAQIQKETGRKEELENEQKLQRKEMKKKHFTTTSWRRDPTSADPVLLIAPLSINKSAALERVPAVSTMSSTKITFLPSTFPISSIWEITFAFDLCL